MQPCDSIRRQSSARTDVSARQARVYSRQGCHLCDLAVDLLVKQGFAVETVDVDQDAELRAQFGECVPVVEIGGKIRFRGRINEVLLNRLIHQTF